MIPVLLGRDNSCILILELNTQRALAQSGPSVSRHNWLRFEILASLLIGRSRLAFR